MASEEGSPKKISQVGADARLDTAAQSARKRIPWLASLLFLGLAVSAVAGVFEASVKHFPLILAFQPLILGMAGNAGTQSLAITLGRIDASEGGGWRRILWRELKTAFFSGLVLGALSFLVVGSFLFAVGKKGAYAFALGGCVGGAMCLSVMLAGLLGALIPLLLYRLHIDPAVASGPLITTVNDIVAIVSYYGLAMLFLRPLV